MVAPMNSQIVEGIAKELCKKVEPIVEKKIQSIFIERGSQQRIIDTKYSHSFVAQGNNSNVRFHADSGRVEGTFIEEVKGYSYIRNGKQITVNSHRRVYENQFPFEDRRGEFIVSDRVPDYILKEILEDSVKEAFRST